MKSDHFIASINISNTPHLITIYPFHLKAWKGFFLGFENRIALPIDIRRAISFLFRAEAF